MCKIGDIIVINEFKNEYDKKVPKHSFVVINDNQDYIEGFKYDFISNMICSFHNEEHRKKKSKYLSTLPTKEGYIIGDAINAKNGYVKADQLYYFDKSKIEFKTIAHMNDEFLKELNQLISKLKKKNYLKKVTTNIKKETIKN